MKHSIFTRSLSLVLLLAMMVSSAATLTVGSYATGETDSSGETASDGSDGSGTVSDYSGRTNAELLELIDNDLYSDYRELYTNVPKGQQDFLIKGVDYDPELTTAKTEIMRDVGGLSDSVLYTGTDGKTYWKFHIEKTGMYAMEVTYYNTEEEITYTDENGQTVTKNPGGTYTTIERMLFLDGKLPFTETRYLYFPRTFTYLYGTDDEYEDRPFYVDINGNDIRPVREEVSMWRTYWIRDWLGFTQDPFEFYLTEGEHTICLESAREPLIIQSIHIFPYEEEASYEETLAKWKASGLQEISGVAPVKVQAETPKYISEMAILPSAERTSCITEPQDPAVVRYNMCSSGTANSFLTYEVNVEKEGLYYIVCRFRQNEQIGVFTNRRVYINGEIQFREASYCRFMYDTPFQVQPLGNGRGPRDDNGNYGEPTYYLFHFKEGVNTITFETVMGEMQRYAYEMRHLTDELQEAYELILTITGPNPDPNRDYGFNRIAVSALQTIAKASAKLWKMYDEFNATTDEPGDLQNTLETAAELFEEMARDDSTIGGNLLSFKNYIVMLENWMYSLLSQPVNFDYFAVTCSDDKLPAAVSNFFQQAWFEIRSFVFSFFMDYTTISFRNDLSEGSEVAATLTTWGGGDRESCLITRRIIDTYFTPLTGIYMEIQIIKAGLQEAIIAGMGPDISSMGSYDTITWGLRDAVMPVNDCGPYVYKGEEVVPGFEEIMESLHPAVKTPLTLYGVTYGLPSSMSFSMIFYRADILAEMDLEMPTTWDGLYYILQTLQNQHMYVGLPTGLGGTMIFLYQQGIPLYADDGKRVNLDSKEALDAFTTLCEFFTNYETPVMSSADIFRTGEQPIQFGDAVGTYNSLMGLTELRGLWEMAPLLASTDITGKKNWTSPVSTGASVIPRGANKDIAWAYLCWNITYEAQKHFVWESRALSSPTTKISSVNLQIFLEQPWTRQEYNAIYTQLQMLESTPEYPGNYLVGDLVGMAFLDAYNNGTVPSDAMLDRILEMNREISRKRKEFGMEAYDVDYSNFSNDLLDQP